MKFLFSIILCLMVVRLGAQSLPPWQEGYFDIHHINTGSGNATFFIFPDGTTFLFDAGDTQRNQDPKNPLKIAPQFPSDTVTAGQCITQYIKAILPKIQYLDYAVVSHFHGDHFGTINSSSKLSKNDHYKLSGITEVNEYLPIHNLFDRNYPTYNIPADVLKNSYDTVSIRNYFNFINYQVKCGKLNAASLTVGTTTQLVPILNQKKYPEFKIRTIAANGNIWSGNGETAISIIPPKIDKKDYNENPLSIGLKISYGSFDYFTGGDLTGLQGFGLPNWFDIETPLSKVIGKVDALSLNHHGVRDATNEAFLKATDPQVIVQQSWSSNHPGEEVLHRIISPYFGIKKRAIFATYVHRETIATYGKWLSDNYKNTEGNIIIRVNPDGKEFMVYVIDDRKNPLTLINSFGPYFSE